MADRFAQGTYRPWVDKVNDYAITRKDAKDTKGEFSTPTIMINGKVWDLTAAAKSQGGLEHLDRACSRPWDSNRRMWATRVRCPPSVPKEKR